MMYDNIDVFIIDEVNTVPAHVLGFVDELMTKCFNKELKKTKKRLLPFGGKHMVLVGDPAQLPPVEGKSFNLPSTFTSSKLLRQSDLKLEREQRGFQIYTEYMRPNVIILQRSYRNVGLLAEISESLRNGTQTKEHLDMLLYQYEHHSNAIPDRGIHYTNETAAAYNLKDVWRKSQAVDKHVHVCKASYFQTGNNQLIVDG